MANIPIRDIPGAVVASPDPSDLIPMDNGSLMQKTTIANAVNTTLPLSSQVEAEAGADNVKRMSSLRTKQAIDAQTPAIVNVAITALNLGTMSQEDASDYTPTSGLAAVALSNDYNDLDNLPTLGTAAATDASDYATAAQGSLADSAVQPGDAQLVPSGGATGQVLVKDSATDYDTGWMSVAAATAVSYAPQSLTPPQQAQARENIGALFSATVKVFTSSGIWTPEDGQTLKFVRVRMVGGGGGAGGTAAGAGAGGGGGGGGYAEKIILATDLNLAGETVTIGAGGTGGTSTPTDGGNGGTSSFGSHCSATGGTGGQRGPSGTTGPYSGGIGVNGDINLAGGSGGNRSTNDIPTTPVGGNSTFGFAESPVVSTSNFNSANLSPPPMGAGGLGPKAVTSGGPYGGQAGGPGLVIVEEYY